MSASPLYGKPLLAPPSARGEESQQKEGSMTTMTGLAIRPFEVHVPDEDLADLGLKRAQEGSA